MAPPLPHVFIFPPEEEQLANPPFCGFDASQCTVPEHDDLDDDPSDSQYIDVALDFIRDSPVYRCASLDELRDSPRNGHKRPSSVLTFINYRDDGAAKDLPEDIVEVIKVKRNEGKVDASASNTTQRSRSIKLPFQKAFRSIKNVARAPSSRKHNVKSIWSSNSSVASKAQQVEIKPQPPSPVLTPSSPLLVRKPSRRLSQLFTRSNNRSNVDLISTFASEPEPEPEPAPAPPPKSPPRSSPLISTAQSSSLPYLRNTDTSPSVDDLGDADTSQIDRPISSSLSSSTSKRSSKRLSVVDLHRLFTFSASSILAEDQDSSPRPSPPPLLDTASTTSSTSSHNYLPIDFSPTFGCDGNLDSNGKSSTQWRATRVQQHRSGGEPVGVPGDIDVEMRLDSLHFDSLSFDPEDFDVSMAVDGDQRL